MGSAFRTWFNQIPGNDAIERQQAGVMQAILLVLMAIIVLGIPISLGYPLITTITIILLVLLAVALRALRRGAFRLGVRLAVGVLIVAIGLSMQVVSLRTSGPILFAFAIPLALAALLLGRRDLIVTTVFSNAFVVAAAVHDILDPREGGRPAAATPLVSVVVAFVLERFGASLRRALRSAAVREHELALARLPLEETVAERTTQLSAEVRAGQEREAQLAQTLDELRASRALVRALSAPIIPVLPGVLVAPIVGSLDDDQARDLTTNVLRVSSSTSTGRLSAAAPPSWTSAAAIVCCILMIGLISLVA